MSDARTITSGMIFDEAREARLTIQEVLDLLNTPSSDEDDPIQTIVKLLAKVVVAQGEILQTLDRVERRIISP